MGAFAKDAADWRDGKIDEDDQRQVLPLVRYLREQTTADETVGQLDTTAGALHALYLARRPLYGRFLNDFHFYHDAQNPYIAGLRRQFLAQFHEGKPSVLLQCKSWPPLGFSGSDGFPELAALVGRDYHTVLEAGDCAVLRHR